MGNINGKKVLQVVRTVETGGSQLYQHNVLLRNTDNQLGNISMQIINDVATEFTLSTLWTYISTNFSVNTSINKRGLSCSGNLYYNSSINGIVVNIYYDSESDVIKARLVQYGSNYSNLTDAVVSFNSSQASIYDEVITL